MNNQKRITIAISVILIVVSNLLIYFCSYKYRGGIATVSLLMIMFGIITVYIICAFHWNMLDKIVYTGDRKEWVIKQSKKGLFNISFILLGVLELYVIVTVPDKRMQHIMETQPTAYANAVVVKIDSTTYRHGSRHYINVIEYSTPKGVIRQDINTKRKYYGIGSIIRVRYSLEYPDMFYYSN